MYRYELSSLQGHSKVNPWCTGADLARGGHSMPPPSDKGVKDYLSNIKLWNIRRVLRDISERGRDLEHVLHQYTTLVKPAFEEFCIPTKKYADVIIPRGAENVVALDLIKQHIEVNGNIIEITHYLFNVLFLFRIFCGSQVK